MVEIVSYDDGRIVDFGECVRIERRARAEAGPDGAPLYRWVLYEKVVAEPDEKGRRIHPVLGRPTTLADVWVPRNEGDEKEMRALAERIAVGGD